MTSDYHELADEIAEDISTGRLAPGQKLLPQREYAYQRGIAASTAGRVYKELVTRGLIAGEVGRGSYVRYAPAVRSTSLAEPPDVRVNLEMNVPGAVGKPEKLAGAFLDLVRNTEVFEQSMRSMPADGWERARQVIASHISFPSWVPAPGRILFAGNGKQSLSAAITAFAGPGDRLGIEALTYPVAKAIAEKHKIIPVPMQMDEFGVLPGEIDRLGAGGMTRAIYLQPCLHNPTVATMPPERREQIALRLRKYGMIAIEDRVYAFLSEDTGPPLAALAPDHVVAVDSLSKRLCAGLSIGLIVAPERFVERCRASINASGLTPQRIPLEIAVRWIVSGVAAEVEQDKREDAANRNSLVRRAMRNWDVATDKRSYHVWLTLPDEWRVEDFVARAGERGIAITPASAFAIEGSKAPNAVRIALASPKFADLGPALKTLVGLLERNSRC
ncbi:MAG: PLP-dependent aminotransferase family protein [Hyphomicrobiaceae bacterium]|nr:PLP-dependent aminotransferase family protein [Hyphomicrobiaceae bacterium]